MHSTSSADEAGDEIATGTGHVMLRLLARSIAIARHTGDIIRAVSRTKDLGVVQKGVNDPQTVADRLSQICIMRSLSKHFPHLQASLIFYSI